MSNSFLRSGAAALALCGPLWLGSPAVRADDSVPPQLTPTSVHPREAKQRVEDFRAGSNATGSYELTFLFYCLKGLATGKLDEAVRTCGEAIRLEPSNSAGYKLRGMAFFGKRQFPEALSDLGRAIALDPHDAETYAARGAVYRERGETRPALQAYDRAIALHPSDSRWWNARCWTRAIARVELRVALADCSRAIALEPASAQAYDSRGLVYFQLRRYRKAIADYSRALANARLASSFFGRGAAKLRLADASGVADIAQARRLDPSIDEKFHHYGIMLTPPRRSPPGHLPMPKPSSPATRPNQAMPARSASLIKLDR